MSLDIDPGQIIGETDSGNVNYFPPGTFTFPFILVNRFPFPGYNLGVAPNPSLLEVPGSCA
jgi:hypothetical protein